MKKSKGIALTSVLLFAIASCGEDKKEEAEWIVGNDENGNTRDTVSQGRQYRYFGGFWYPLIAGRIAPGLYQGASRYDIGRPGFTPARSAPARSGGFGTSSRPSAT